MYMSNILKLRNLITIPFQHVSWWHAAASCTDLMIVQLGLLL